MKLPAVFLAGAACGFAVAQLRPQPVAASSVPSDATVSVRSDGVSVDFGTRVASGNGVRPADPSGFDRRLRAALAAAPPAESELTGTGDEGSGATRIREWARSIDIPAAEIEAELARSGPGDPLLAGSSFDARMRGRLGPQELAEWEALQQEHAVDLLELRTFTVMAGLQRELPLSEKEKDALFDVLGQRLLPAELDLIGRGDWPQGEEAARRIETWTETLAPLVEPTHREELEAWLVDQLPGFWQQEATGG
jgi:hypothetical protein